MKQRRKPLFQQAALDTITLENNITLEHESIVHVARKPLFQQAALDTITLENNITLEHGSIVYMLHIMC